MIDLIVRPWPWYVAGPLIGLFVPALLVLGRQFGFSANLRHACAAIAPRRPAYLRYDWKGTGGWNLVFATGTLIGGFIAGWLFANPEPIAISAATVRDLTALGITDFTGLVPAEVFSWSGMLSLPGLVAVVGGGFLVGFGTAYGGGCTSGHGLTGIGDLQLPSLIAMIGFFVGGVIATFLLFPLIF